MHQSLCHYNISVIEKEKELKEQENDKKMDHSSAPSYKLFDFRFQFHFILYTTSGWITTYFDYKPRLNGVYSRDNLPRINDKVYAINLDDKQSKKAHWVSLLVL